jgi:hypothetical protein
MKKILLTITAIASTFAGMAQAPDFNFETWNNIFGSTIQDPQGFASLNTLAAFNTGTAQSVFKETTAPFAGLASAKITTVKVVGAMIPNPYQPGTNLDTAGLLAIGAIDIGAQSITYGTTFNMRPAILSFQSKYSPMAGDSAFVLAFLTKWNGNSTDTIATGVYKTGTATTSYALSSITLDYNPAFATVVPDSQQVFISSSVYSHDGAKIGSTFYIDDLAWSGWNSVNDINGVMVETSAYPNPASSYITFNSSTEISKIEISDVTGRLVGSYPANASELKVTTENFIPGLYIYNIFDNNKIVVGRNRFQITK